MQHFLTFLATLTILAALMPLIRTDAWWVRSLDFPRGQIAALGFIVFVAMFWLLRPLSTFSFCVLLALLLSLAFLAYRIIPYTILAPKQVPSATRYTESIRILSSNVLQSNRDTTKLIKLINRKAADVVLVIETDSWWEESLRVIEAAYPFQVKHPLDNTYGMILYSKIEIETVDIKFLTLETTPSIFATLALPSGKKIELICVHPQPPRPDKMQDSTERDAELLIVAKYAEHKNTPVIVTGDFNDVAWSHSTRLFQRIGGLLDPRIGRGMFSTFPADYPFLRYPLDHIFHSRHFRVIEIERLEHIGSDHFPVYAALSLEEGPVVEEPEADSQDDEEAKRMIRNAFEEDGSGE